MRPLLRPMWYEQTFFGLSERGPWRRSSIRSGGCLFPKPLVNNSPARETPSLVPLYCSGYTPRLERLRTYTMYGDFIAVE